MGLTVSLGRARRRKRSSPIVHGAVCLVKVVRGVNVFSVPAARATDRQADGVARSGSIIFLAADTRRKQADGLGAS